MGVEACANGHDRTPENTYVSPKGQRSCRICRKLNQKKYVESGGHAQVEARRRASGTVQAYQRKYYAENRDKLVSQRAQNQQRIRRLVLQKYGGDCVCCGETEPGFLVIDHINGGGKADRASAPKGLAWLRKLLKEPTRKDLQILCANCNTAKERGVCPHQMR